eukprot:6475565-Amphidinium_carterae.4
MVKRLRGHQLWQAGCAHVVRGTFKWWCMHDGTSGSQIATHCREPNLAHHSSLTSGASNVNGLRLVRKSLPPVLIHFLRTSSITALGKSETNTLPAADYCVESHGKHTSGTGQQQGKSATACSIYEADTRITHTGRLDRTCRYAA